MAYEMIANEMPERIWATPLGEPDGGFWYSPCADKTDKTEYVLATTHQRTLEAERDAWVAELRPLIEAGAFEGSTLTPCEKCGAMLTSDEVASAIADVRGCWRMATGRDTEPCPGENRKRVTAALARIKEATP